MKDSIIINQRNNISHIIHLDQEKIPITIKKLPKTVAYMIQNVPILTTTTKTLQNLTITQIRQKNKTITKPTHIIILKDKKTMEKIKIETIKENPLITIHLSTPEKLHERLKEILERLTPENENQIKLKDTKLYQKCRKIKEYQNTEYAQSIAEILNNNPELKLQEAEYKAQKEYYKHISYDKRSRTYKLTLNRKTINRHNKLIHALQERRLRTDNTEDEEETLCQKEENNTQPLPPPPWLNPMHQLYKNHNKYTTTRHENTPKYNNPDVATLVRMKKTSDIWVKNVQKPLRNIIKKKNTYHITKHKNKQQHTYYRTEKNQWRCTSETNWKKTTIK